MRKYLWIGAISAAVLLCLSGCSNPEGGDGKDKEAAPVEIEAAASGYDPAWEQLFDETEISEAFREDLREFAFDSTAAASSKTDGNMVFSPLSLYYALSILGTGASGETEAEILEALGVRDKAELASQCGKLYRRYVYSQEQEKAIAGENGIEAQESAVRLANSLWISEKHVLNPKYQELCSEEFYASSYYVDFTDPETGKLVLNAILNQRSNDVLAANNWNVVQYAVLVHMLAQVCGMVAGELVHVIADAHIYDRHIPLIEELISRESYPAPKFWLNPEVKDFYDFTPDDVKLIDYQHGEQIRDIPIAI